MAFLQTKISNAVKTLFYIPIKRVIRKLLRIEKPNVNERLVTKCDIIEMQASNLVRKSEYKMLLFPFNINPGEAPLVGRSRTLDFWERRLAKLSKTFEKTLLAVITHAILWSQSKIFKKIFERKVANHTWQHSRRIPILKQDKDLSEETSYWFLNV